MFYDKFAMIYKAYDYKLVYIFSTCGRPEYFLWLSVFEMIWTHRQDFYFLQYILYSVPPHNLCGYLNNFPM